MSWLLLQPPALPPPLLEPGFVPAFAALNSGSILEFASVGLRHAPLLLLFALHLCAAGATGTDSAEVIGDETCSKTLGFNESQVPKDRSYQDLIGCDEHHKRTCCERNHSIKIRGLWGSFAAESSPRCAKLSQLVLCSLCDADVGVGHKVDGNSVMLCPSLCNRWFQACVEDFFVPATSDQLHPCSVGSLVCSPLSQIAKDGVDFCSRVVAPMGSAFSVASVEEEPDACYDGVPTSKSKGPGPRALWTRPVDPVNPLYDLLQSWLRDNQGWLRHYQRWLRDNAAGILIAIVAVFFALFLWRNVD